MNLAAVWLQRLLSITLFALACGQATAATPTVAFHYGWQPPVEALRSFDLVVLDPDAKTVPAQLPKPTEWAAYVSIGEVAPDKPWAKHIKPSWVAGENASWKSRVLDVAAPGYADFMIEQVFVPLWAAGWRSFFLDTLDSYHRYATTPAARREREDALVVLVERLHARLPGVRLVFNRGFEIAPRLKGKIAALAAESLYGAYDPGRQQYLEVNAKDRAWLSAQLRQVQTELGIPAIVVDYAPPADRARARDLAARIRADGFIPWVSNGALDVMGVGDLEVQPRRIVLVTDRMPRENFQTTAALRALGLPLNHLGYVIDVIDVREPLPATLDPGLTAGVVTWFSQPAANLNPGYEAWLARQQAAGIKLVLMNEPGLAPDSPLLRRLGFRPATIAPGPRRIERSAAMIGFEAAPSIAARDGATLRQTGAGERLLTLTDARGTAFDAVGVTPWGGYAFAPFALEPLGLGESGERWVVDPIAFLHAALGSPAAPVPDVSTEAGRRILMAHIDGDGFASRAEQPGSPFAADVMRSDILERYAIPHTVSVIEGETGASGVYPELSPALEAIARRIFALPNVEIASHSYSHPFFWRAAAGQVTSQAYDGKDLNLAIPGYQFNLEREIAGSIRYIDRLAPPGKRTKVFLWTGDTAPGPDAIAATERAGLLNMNGGDTTITRSNPTLAAAAGFGLRRQGTLQVFAPMQNENVYTNLWTGPFYGYQRVIETFELTGSPRRLKPMNIYYHTYSASKPAALNALRKVYTWALAQPNTPLYGSDYILKVRDFDRLAVARDWRSAEPRWRIRGDGEVRTLRLPADTPVALAASHNLAGLAPGPRAHYLHLTAGEAEIVTPAAARPDPSPYLLDANGRVSQLVRAPGRFDFVLTSYVAPSFRLAQATGCRIRIDGREVKPVGGTSAGPQTYEVARTPSLHTPQSIKVAVACSR